MLTILTDDDPILREISDPIPEEEIKTLPIYQLSEDMINACHGNNGKGLAAPQVGVLKRMIVVLIGDKYVTMINPEIVKSRELVTHKKEMCLSFPGVRVDRERYKYVTVTYLDMNGKTQKQKFRGLDGICIQHEIDHLDGIVIGDAINKEECLDNKGAVKNEHVK
jgi:peptide deformylase